jgi:hypothetical protein
MREISEDRAELLCREAVAGAANSPAAGMHAASPIRGKFGDLLTAVRNANYPWRTILGKLGPILTIMSTATSYEEALQEILALFIG